MRIPSSVAIALMVMRASLSTAQSLQQPSQPPVLSTLPTPALGTVAEPAQMSGFPLQVGDLPPGIVAVRVIAERFSNNLVNQTVDLRVTETGVVRSAVTNQDGRAQFDGLQTGQHVQVRSAVGLEVLESQTFAVPAQGGVRLVLVAGVGAPAGSSDPWVNVEASGTTLATAPPADSAAPTPPVFAMLGIASLVFAGGLVVQHRKQRGRAAANRRHDASVLREGLAEALVQLERAHAAGGIGHEDYASRRDDLLKALVDADNGATGIA